MLKIRNLLWSHCTHDCHNRPKGITTKTMSFAEQCPITSKVYPPVFKAQQLVLNQGENLGGAAIPNSYTHKFSKAN